jgi:hypothetical protein
MKNNRIIYSLIALIVAIVTTISVTFAWFLTQSYLTGKFYILSGNSDVNVNVYLGTDSNRDGILDPVVDANGDILDLTTRSQIIQNQYVVATNEIITNDTDELGTKYSDVVTGNKLTFKIVVENPSTNSYSSYINLYFADMEQYFYDYIQYYITNNSTLPSEATMVDLLGNNSSRLLYQLTDLNVKIYNGDSSNNSLTTGYSTLNQSSSDSDIVSGVTKINKINDLTPMANTTNSYNLWQISNSQKIVNDIAINRNQLAEINFCLYFGSVQNVANNYPTFASSYYLNNCKTKISKISTDSSLNLTDTQIQTYAQNYIEDMVNSEITYFGTDTDSGTAKKLDFKISSIHIEAWNSDKVMGA